MTAYGLHGIICDEEAVADKRVKVFHIENCGQGLARNYGLRAAGKYICFADADDRVDIRTSTDCGNRQNPSTRMSPWGLLQDRRPNRGVGARARRRL
ncbi:MAG: glycosyltransferase [Blautia wexlerae]